MKKPIIGIVSKYIDDQQGRTRAYVQEPVKNAIIENGGIAIGILSSEPVVEFTPANSADNWEESLTKRQQEDLIAQIKLCDGVVLQGGKDSLKYERFIAKYTFDNDIPTLGICAGQNNMIRAVGGTTKNVLNPEKHNQRGVEIVHDVFVEKKSQFYKIVKCKTMPVNSRHKRIIDNQTSHYSVAAVCEDGYPDVLEAPNKKFNFAIRFHPENLYKKYKQHNAIFKAFINACKK